ncbi:MAG TPA: hypothetical protein VFK09_07660, partial [Gemmatimonadales bacterium]|nr:hypothetical protein [Gemmatimonadales bacterium]
AGALLLIGLPIMLVTGLHERRRAIAQTTLVSAPLAESGLARWFTWRRALLGGGLAFGGLAVVAVAYTAMRVLGIGPVGTLVASGVLEKREPIVLADFESHTTDTTLGSALTEALRVDLAQSPTVRLVPPQAIRDALQRMERPATGTLPVSLARELAERVGSKAVVAGQIDQVAGGYVLSATILAATDGRVLTAVRETADDPTKLLRAIDALSRKLRERVGESLVTIRENPALEQVTTASLPALRKYSAALRLEDADRPAEAIPQLEEAVALDSGFAMAWRKLAVINSNLGRSNARVIAASTKAYEHRDRLPELERDLAVAFYHANVEYDPAKVIAAYQSALALDPDNGIALNNLALTYNASRRWAEADTLAQRAIRVGTGSASAYFDNALEAEIALGRFDDARRTLARNAAVAAGRPTYLMHQATLAAAERDWSTADSVVRRLQRDFQSLPDLQVVTAEMLARMAERAGKLGEAEQQLRAKMAANEARGLGPAYVAAATDLADMALRYRDRPAAALDLTAAALAKYPLDSMPALDRPYAELASIYARAGKLDQAKRLMRRFDAEVPAGVRRRMWWRHWTEGDIARAEGRMTDALAAYRAVYDEGGACNVCGLFDLAETYDAMGQADSAIALYQRTISTPTADRIRGDGRTLAPSLKRLGELYEAKGDRKQAVEYYQRFADLWKDADPELQPGVKEVRARLARLAREPGE